MFFYTKLEHLPRAIFLREGEPRGVVLVQQDLDCVRVVGLCVCELFGSPMTSLFDARILQRCRECVQCGGV